MTALFAAFFNGGRRATRSDEAEQKGAEMQTMTDDGIKTDSDLSWKEYITVAHIQKQNDRKFIEEDLLYGEDRAILIDAAETYAKTYRGKFEFMLDMRAYMLRKGYLSPGMAKGTLNCIVAEWRRVNETLESRERARELAKTDHPAGPKNEFRIPEGKYTVVRPNGEYHTLQIRDLSERQLEKYDKVAGTRIISYLNGPDNTSDYKAFGWIWPDGSLQVWGRFKNDSSLVEDANSLLSMNRDGVLNTTEAYALKSGRCSQCGRELTVEESIQYGMGPVCRGRFF